MSTQIERACARAASVGEVAAPERLHPLHERLLGAGGQQDHPQRRRTGSSRSERASESSTATPVRLSLAPGTTARAADVGHRGGVARAEERRRSGAARRRPSRAPSATSQRPADGAPHRPGRGVRVLGELREAAQQRARQLGMEHQARVRGVVVGDHDDGALGVLGARSRPRRSWWSRCGQQRAPEPLLPAGDVVGHRRRGEQAAGHAGDAPEACPGQPPRPR